MDVLTPEQRRKNMQHIKSKDTAIEITLRKALWKKGYRYRKNYKKLPENQTLYLLNTKSQSFVIVNFFMGRTGK